MQNSPSIINGGYSMQVSYCVQNIILVFQTILKQILLPVPI